VQNNSKRPVKSLIILLYIYGMNGVWKKINLLLKLGFKLNDERWFGAEDMITGHNSKV